MGEFRMPALGADMTQGTIVDWLVKPGDVVHRGEFVASVDTDKSVIDVETFEDGVVAELLADVGDVVPVGAPLARITPAGAGSPPPPVERPPASPPVRRFAERAGVDLASVHGTGAHGEITHDDVTRAARPAAPAAPPAPAAPQVPAVPAAPGAHQRSSPRARKLAAASGVDLTDVVGTGPGGAVTERDLRPAPPVATAEPPRAGGKRAEGLRRTIGSLMARSKKTIPHYYLHTTVDLRAATAWLAAANTGRPVSSRLVPAALLLKATALAARETPQMNGTFVDGSFRPSGSVHLGVVVALRTGGVLAPAIHDADRLGVDELMASLHDLVARARSGRLRRAEMTDATLTVTDLGELGVDGVLGVIYPPQVALVGFGRVTEQAWAHDGMVGSRPAVTASLSADHRVSDGMRGARFLARIDELLQEPEAL